MARLAIEWRHLAESLFQPSGVIEATAGMYGDLQGIAGRSLQEIEGLEVKAIGSVGEANGRSDKLTR